MIYQQTSVTINSNIENAWNILKKTMTTSEMANIFPECSNIEIEDDSEGQIHRKLILSDSTEKEVVTVNFTQYRVNSVSKNNPSYFGEISYILLRPSESFLNDQQCSLVIISAWRMHPGVLAASTIDKMDYIKKIGKNLKKEIETQKSHSVSSSID